MIERVRRRYALCSIVLIDQLVGDVNAHEV